MDCNQTIPNKIPRNPLKSPVANRLRPLLVPLPQHPAVVPLLLHRTRLSSLIFHYCHNCFYFRYCWQSSIRNFDHSVPIFIVYDYLSAYGIQWGTVFCYGATWRREGGCWGVCVSDCVEWDCLRGSFSVNFVSVDENASKN